MSVRVQLALLLTLFLAAVASVAACYVGPTEAENPARGAASPATEPAPVGGPSSGPRDAANGLPCDVDALLAKRCRSCHVVGGPAPMPLVTYEDLSAASGAGRTFAELSLERMRSASQPMPPLGERASQSEQGVIQSWIDAGRPRGACGALGGDAGGDSGTLEAPRLPTCTSGVVTTSNRKGPDMRPGNACITCHAASEDEPVVWIGGTVYPTLHEPDDCVATASAGAMVVVTDARGREVRLPVGPTGNFSLSAKSSAPLTMPIRAKVVKDGAERAMLSAQSTGDCNSCHTVRGTRGAPGRIALP